jgi:Icc protein
MNRAALLIAQITDCHIGFDPSDPDEDNVRRLRAVLDQLARGPDRPDLVLLTGDLTARGHAADYARLAEVLAGYDLPVRLMIGNHDQRGAMLSAFPDMPGDDGFLQFVAALPGLRVIALDTVEAGRHAGAFCDARAAWLGEQLDADPQTPVLIAMHHPPIVSGIDWLDGGDDEPWIARFAAAIAVRPQVRAIVAGHLHRTIFTTVAGVPLSVCPSCAPAVSLDLRAIDARHPDGRAMVAGEPAGYALHRWDGGVLVSHFGAVLPDRPWPTLASFDGSMQETVLQNERERSF